MYNKPCDIVVTHYASTTASSSFRTINLFFFSLLTFAFLSLFSTVSQAVVVAENQTILYYLIEMERKIPKACPTFSGQNAPSLVPSEKLRELAIRSLNTGEPVDSIVRNLEYTVVPEFTAALNASSPQEAFNSMSTSYCSTLHNPALTRIGASEKDNRWVVLMASEDPYKASAVTASETMGIEPLNNHDTTPQGLNDIPYKSLTPEERRALETNEEQNTGPSSVPGEDREAVAPPTVTGVAGTQGSAPAVLPLGSTLSPESTQPIAVQPRSTPPNPLATPNSKFPQASIPSTQPIPLTDESSPPKLSGNLAPQSTPPPLKEQYNSNDKTPSPNYVPGEDRDAVAPSYEIGIIKAP